MFKQNRISLEDALRCVEEYKTIPIQFHEVDLKKSLELSFKYKMYAYDAFLLSCCLDNNTPLLTLDMKLLEKARKAGAKILEI